MIDVERENALRAMREQRDTWKREIERLNQSLIGLNIAIDILTKEGTENGS